MSKYEWYLLMRSKRVKKFLKLLLMWVFKCLEMLIVTNNNELKGPTIAPASYSCQEYPLPFYVWYSVDFREEGFFFLQQLNPIQIFFLWHSRLWLQIGFNNRIN